MEELHSMLHINKQPYEVCLLSSLTIFLHQQHLLDLSTVKLSSSSSIQCNKSSKKKGQQKRKKRLKMLIKGNLYVSAQMRVFLCFFTIFTINWHLIAIFTSPHNIWFRKTFGATLERYIRSFPHDQIIACQWLDDNWWNWKRRKIWIVVLWIFNKV